ncbi:TetR/AcrR family transcriptional regulator [Caballeronia humi]|uniref:TetR family transcriptional regulator n=1 Tax=Caballeronia humi TaxID=326474 RepID=A0A158F925_9BURK|nr:TetR/AcrR family transcriptional regulator [Caballeronia humi]SAL16294.1 TetR family transcriptional regulator [Caballeronia humi]
MSSVDEETVRRPRGRPRAFDREAALRRAMELFWAKGYDHCSMNDLVDAMGINSPSIYAAFGSKESLFREALALYGKSEGATAQDALQEPVCGREAIKTMLRRNVELFTCSGKPRGCMLILGALNIGAEHEELHVMLKKRRQAIATLVRKRLSKAAEEGELPSSADISVLTALCMTMLSGLSMQAHDCVPRAVLFSAIDMFVASLPFIDTTP